MCRHCQRHTSNRTEPAMNELSNQSLVYLVQLVAEELRRIEDDIDDRDAEDPSLPDLEEELLDCSKAATELQGLYESAERTSDHLPKYSQLIEN
jgi:hypothetical protein